MDNDALIKLLGAQVKVEVDPKSIALLSAAIFLAFLLALFVYGKVLK